MLCHYRFYVRPNAERPNNVSPAKPRETVTSPPPQVDARHSVVDTAPHVAIVRQYAW